jgi:hypothetical protein
MRHLITCCPQSLTQTRYTTRFKSTWCGRPLLSKKSKYQLMFTYEVISMIIRMGIYRERTWFILIAISWLTFKIWTSYCLIIIVPNYIRRWAFHIFSITIFNISYLITISFFSITSKQVSIMQWCKTISQIVHRIFRS